MSHINNILATKLSYRFCRKKIQMLPSIQFIVQECCENLKIKEPKILFCESLTKDFQAFDLRNTLYFIYDSCLMETLYLYNSIIFSGLVESDIDKLFYKLFGEELVIKKDITSSMYFVGKYTNMCFSFDNNKFNNTKVREYLSMQNYFLIGHELTHLSLKESESVGIPKQYVNYILAAMTTFAEQDIAANKKNDFFEYASYFLDNPPESLNDYSNKLSCSKKFMDFVEECYCDHIGISLLLGYYEKAKVSLKAIAGTLNCLIMLESIRDILRDGIMFIKDSTKKVTRTLYFSILRTKLLLCTIEASKLDTASVLDSIHKYCKITSRLMHFVQNLPSGEAFASTFNIKLHQHSQNDILNLIIQQLYYVSISPDF